MPHVGVLALQGDVREHVAMLEEAGAKASPIRTAEQLQNVDALVLPGGESTAIAYLLGTSGIRPVLASLIDEGMPVFGTCAGLILLSSSVLDGRADQWSFNALDVSVRRNGYGRQIASFEANVVVQGIGPVPGVFIRAPRIETTGNVEVVATYDHGDGDHPVLVRSGKVMGCSFHPELTTDSRIHQMFIASI